MDIDGDGAVGALTDGLMIIRYLFKFSGDLLVNNAIGPDAVVTGPCINSDAYRGARAGFRC